MNKISKKILAIVTMAAFVVTMMPFAAFAAPVGSDTADVQTSGFAIVKNGEAQTEAAVEAGEDLTAQFFIRDNAGYGTSADLSAGETYLVKVWTVQEDQTTPSSALKVTGVNDNLKVNADKLGDVYQIDGTTAVNDGEQLKVSFSRPGTYTLYAGVGAGNDITKIDALQGMTPTKITVGAADVDVATVDLAVDGTNLTAVNTITDLENNDTAKVKATTAFLLNGIQEVTITGTAYQQDGTTPAIGQEFNLRSSNSKLALADTTVTTDAYGKFKIKFSIDGSDTYRIYATGDVNFTIEIDAENSAIDKITSIADDAQTMLAGDDKYFDTAYGTNYNEDAYLLEDAVQLEITNKAGDTLEQDAAIAGQPAADVNDADNQHNNYVRVTGTAEGATLEASDLELAWSAAKEAYTLKYVGGNADKDLLPGEYTVVVGLTSGESVTVHFTLANYGTTEDMVINVTNAGKELTDEVVLASNPATQLQATAEYVDENGITINATGDVQYGFNGRAVDTAATNGTVANGIGVMKAANESLLGTVVTVTAFDSDIPMMKQVTLTVVDGYNEYTLAFDGENGLVNENNEVAVSVVDEDGDVADVKGTILAYVDTQSNEDAVVEVDVDKNVNAGKGAITITSDQETTVNVVVAVKTDDDKATQSGQIYAGTLEYTIGEEDVNADTTVVMTIGSSDIVVNNDVVTGDAAPFVDSNWRTMVPVRALSQSFGGSAEWDGDARTVTVENGDTTIVFNADSDKYTVNGEEKTMDTELTIVDGRTYVPVKFVAEELGYTVTALKDAAGLTASVVIQK